MKKLKAKTILTVLIFCLSIIMGVVMIIWLLPLHTNVKKPSNSSPSAITTTNQGATVVMVNGSRIVFDEDFIRETIKFGDQNYALLIKQWETALHSGTVTQEQFDVNINRIEEERSQNNRERYFYLQICNHLLKEQIDNETWDNYLATGLETALSTVANYEKLAPHDEQYQRFSTYLQAIKMENSEEYARTYLSTAFAFESLEKALREDYFQKHPIDATQQQEQWEHYVKTLYETAEIQFK